VPSAAAVPPLPEGVVLARERPEGDGLFVHVEWAATLPWLVQGITAAGDMSLFAVSPAGVVLGRWARLRDANGAHAIVHSRQVHEARVLCHEDVPAGILVAPDADGHATAQEATLLAVSVADCVPISIVSESRRAIALLHGGWRGVAAGILEAGVALLEERFSAAATGLRVHFGPAICGACFEVGAEVPERLGVSIPAEPGGRRHLDLRAVLAERAIRLGVRPEAVSTSAFCTRCGDSPFYSHRGGCAERQVAVLGIRGA
jgi:polyphenol oxidase